MPIYDDGVKDPTAAITLRQQDAEPTLGSDGEAVLWQDTNDSDRTYLLTRRGAGDQIAVELT